MKKAYHIKLSSLYDRSFFVPGGKKGGKLFTFDLMRQYQVRQALLTPEL